MEKTTAFEPTGTDEPTDLPAAAEECIRRIDAAREQITSDQTDIDHLQQKHVPSWSVCASHFTLREFLDWSIDMWKYLWSEFRNA